MRTGQLAVKRVEKGSWLLLEVAGPLNYDQARAWQRELGWVWRSRALHILVDLSGATYVDTAGVALLLAASWRARRESRSWRLVGLSPQARRVLELTHLDECLCSGAPCSEPRDSVGFGDAPQPKEGRWLQ